MLELFFFLMMVTDAGSPGLGRDSEESTSLNTDNSVIVHEMRDFS